MIASPCLYLLALNRFGTVVPKLRKHLYQHPLRERSWAQLMLAQYRAVGAAAALATYADARHVIGKELGIEPDPMLADLHRAILSRSPELLHDPPAMVLARPGHG